MLSFRIFQCFRCVSPAAQKPEDVIKKYMEEMRVIPDEVRVASSSNCASRLFRDVYLLRVVRQHCVAPRVFYSLVNRNVISCWT